MKNMLAALRRALEPRRAREELLRADRLQETIPFSPWRALVTWRTPK